MQKINEYQENTTGQTYALLEQVEIREDKRGRKFIAMILADKTGKINAKIWNATVEDEKNFISGKVVYFEGRKEMYQGRPQMRLLNIRLATSDEPSDPKLYQYQQDINLTEAKVQIQNYIQQISDPIWSQIVIYLLEKYNDEFYSYPAAKFHHHAFEKGLVIHTLGMLKLAEQVVKIYPNLHSDLLYASIILHDLGKVIELSGLQDTHYTLEGNLCGHIILIVEEVVLAAQQLNIDSKDEKVTLLKHMLLSHHGKLEYGSPVVPCLMEAEVLTLIDQMDAKMQMLTQALDQTPVGEYTQPISGFEQRSFYKFD